MGFALICRICLYIGAVLAGGIGIAVLAGMNPLIELGLQMELQVVNGSVEYDAWKASSDDAPVYLDVWIWNYTNADQYTIDADGKVSFPMPVLEEVGPFRYLEKFTRTEIDYIQDDGNIVDETQYTDDIEDTLMSIRSKSTTRYYPAYDPNDPSTGLDPNASKVNIMNLVALGLPKVVDYLLVQQFGDFDEARGPDKIIMNQIIGIVNDIWTKSGALPIVKDLTAQQALWEYEDPVLKELVKECKESPLIEECPEAIANLEPMMGLLVSSNSSSGSYYQQKTGVDDYRHYLEIEKFGGSTKDEMQGELTWWLQEPAVCNELAGSTDGSNWFPDWEEGQSIYLFSSDLYTALPIEYEATTESPNEGFETRTYNITYDALAAPAENPDNACLIMPTFWNNSQAPTSLDPYTDAGGFLVTSSASAGLPLTISNPHFLWADKLRSVSGTGYKPNAAIHTTWLEYEPMTGSPIQANKRIQQSLVIVKDKRFSFYDGMGNDTIGMPLIWVNENFVLSASFEKDVAFGVVFLPNLLLGVGVAATALGGILLLSAIAWSFRARMK